MPCSNKRPLLITNLQNALLVGFAPWQLLLLARQERNNSMEDTPSAGGEQSTHGCMECKAQRPYTVEQFPNGNTGWRCVVCGKMLRLIPGKYTSTVGERGSDAEPLLSCRILP
jgi:hypothetical protein